MSSLFKWQYSSLYGYVSAEFVVSVLFAWVTVSPKVGSMEMREAKISGLISLSVAAILFCILFYCTPGFHVCKVAPWVTFGLWVARRMTPVSATLTMVSQFVGAVVGVGLAKLLTKIRAYNHSGGGANSMHDTGWGVALATDVIAAFLFLFAVLAAIDRRAHRILIAMNFLAPFGIFGKADNPAIGLAVAIFSKDQRLLGGNWVFFVGTSFVGAGAAAVLYENVFGGSPPNEELEQAIGQAQEVIENVGDEFVVVLDEGHLPDEVQLHGVGSTEAIDELEDLTSGWNQRTKSTIARPLSFSFF